MKRTLLIFSVFLFLLFLLSACQGEAKQPSDESMIKDVVNKYLVAQKAYDIEKQMDLLSAHDRKEIDYAVLKKAQPGIVIRMLFTRYGEAQITKVEILPQKPHLANCYVHYKIPAYKEINEKFVSTPETTIYELGLEAKKSLIATGNQNPSQQDILQKVVEKIYYGKEWPTKEHEKCYNLVKEEGAWRIEKMWDHWQELTKKS